MSMGKVLASGISQQAKLTRASRRVKMNPALSASRSSLAIKSCPIGFDYADGLVRTLALIFSA